MNAKSESSAHGACRSATNHALSPNTSPQKGQKKTLQIFFAEHSVLFPLEKATCKNPDIVSVREEWAEAIHTTINDHMGHKRFQLNQKVPVKPPSQVSPKSLANL
jgi:hypothetical protein